MLNLRRADDVVLIKEGLNKLQGLLRHVNVNAATLGMHFALTKGKMLLQEWFGSKSSLIVEGGKLDVVNKFSYLVGCISPSGHVSAELSSRMKKGQSEFTVEYV